MLLKGLKMKDKIEHLLYLRSEVMAALGELKLLTEKICDEEEIASAQIFGNISNKIAKRAYKVNESIGRILEQEFLR